MPENIKDVRFVCQYCGYENMTYVHLNDEKRQEFLSDCYICHQPNRIKVLIDEKNNISIVEVKMVNW